MEDAVEEGSSKRSRVSFYFRTSIWFAMKSVEKKLFQKSVRRGKKAGKGDSLIENKMPEDRGTVLWKRWSSGMKT